MRSWKRTRYLSFVHVWVRPELENSCSSGSPKVLKASQRIWSDRSRWRTLLVALARDGSTLWWSGNTWAVEKQAKTNVILNAFNPSIRFPGFLSLSNQFSTLFSRQRERNMFNTGESWGFCRHRWEITGENS